MASIERSIEVDVPVRVAYDQWTQFESFPSFMEGVKEVKQIDDKRLRWRAEGATERAGDTLGIVSARVQGGLDHFKEFIESRREPTGAWRGTIHGGVRVDDAGR